MPPKRACDLCYSKKVGCSVASAVSLFILTVCRSPAIGQIETLPATGVGIISSPAHLTGRGLESDAQSLGRTMRDKRWASLTYVCLG